MCLLADISGVYPLHFLIPTSVSKRGSDYKSCILFRVIAKEYKVLWGYSYTFSIRFLFVLRLEVFGVCGSSSIRSVHMGKKVKKIVLANLSICNMYP